jgi:hypothetical protein
MADLLAFHVHCKFGLLDMGSNAKIFVAKC